MAKSIQPSPDETPSRWVGYLGYDLGRRFEQIPSTAIDDAPTPLFVFSLHDLLDGSIPPPAEPIQRPASEIQVLSTFTPQSYRTAVARAVDYIADGDVFQINLSQRFTAFTGISSAELSVNLRAAGGARYGALLNYGDFSLVSNSPELFLRVTANGRITTCPIKGTRPRQPGMDRVLEQSLKDQAELNMIVDLERNDLGRICRTGTVRVTDPRRIEAHPTVFHGVATIEGELRPEVGFVDLLAAVFPGGSITGAPKVRAMQIIELLEPVRRGVYCGAIGYLGSDGSMEFNVAIRTAMVLPDRVLIPVGGGIVADSDPAEEYHETLTKARAIFQALGARLPTEI